MESGGPVLVVLMLKLSLLSVFSFSLKQHENIYEHFILKKDIIHLTLINLYVI